MDDIKIGFCIISDKSWLDPPKSTRVPTRIHCCGSVVGRYQSRVFVSCVRLHQFPKHGDDGHLEPGICVQRECQISYGSFYCSQPVCCRCLSLVYPSQGSFPRWRSASNQHLLPEFGGLLAGLPMVTMVSSWSCWFFVPLLRLLLLRSLHFYVLSLYLCW